ncbi:MAG: hypothetical protein N4A71_25340 [Carboxylicivirga sp.]|jgi:hypothetical protein|nr:hypothetical protein [Carboxylicivirga sp.]MCT4645189.1 hypothetical protein [Carboxylicivirga sp.]
MRRLNKIPLSIIIKVLFSNKLTFTGLFVIAVSGVLLLTFLPNTDPHVKKYQTEEVQTNKGIITDISDTNISVNGNQIHKYTYKFELKGNAEEGHSFSKLLEANVGDTVQVEYLKEDRSISRIEGTRNGAFDRNEALAMLLILFTIGLSIILYTLYQKLVFIRVLKTGFHIVAAKLSSELKIPFISGKRGNTYILKFNYTIENRQYTKSRFAEISNFKLNRVRHGNLLVDHENYGKAYLIELLPEKLITLIKKNIEANNEG